MKTATVLVFAGAAAAQSSSYVYSNPMTAYTTLTNSLGVVTGQPSANTDVNTNVVTSQPTPNLNVNTNVVTSQPTLVTVPAGLSSAVGSASPYTPSATYLPPVGPGATGAPSLAPYVGTPAGTPVGTPGTPVGTPSSTPSSSSSSESGSSTGSSSGSRTSSSSRPTSTSGAAAVVQVSGGVLGLVGFIFAAFL